MTRQAFIRVLLSLLLLFSQQMATTHAMSHWFGSPDAAFQSEQAGDKDLSSTFGKDQSCHKCLAFAQLDGPLLTTFGALAAPELVAPPVHRVDLAVANTRTILAFRSRAPPQA